MVRPEESTDALSEAEPDKKDPTYAARSPRLVVHSSSSGAHSQQLDAECSDEIELVDLVYGGRMCHRFGDLTPPSKTMPSIFTQDANASDSRTHAVRWWEQPVATRRGKVWEGIQPDWPSEAERLMDTYLRDQQSLCALGGAKPPSSDYPSCSSISDGETERTAESDETEELLCSKAAYAIMMDPDRLVPKPALASSSELLTAHGRCRAIPARATPVVQPRASPERSGTVEELDKQRSKWLESWAVDRAKASLCADRGEVAWSIEPKPLFGCMLRPAHLSQFDDGLVYIA